MCVALLVRKYRNRSIIKRNDRSRQMARTILEQNRQLLASTAAVLLDREVLEGDDLRQILSQAKAHAGLSRLVT